VSAFENLGDRQDKSTFVILKELGSNEVSDGDRETLLFGARFLASLEMPLNEALAITVASANS